MSTREQIGLEYIYIWNNNLLEISSVQYCNSSPSDVDQTAHIHIVIFGIFFSLSLCLFSYFCMRHNVHFLLLVLSFSFVFWSITHWATYATIYSNETPSSFFSFLPPLNNNHINKSTHIYIHRERGRMSPNHITIDCVNEFDYPTNAFGIITA